MVCERLQCSNLPDEMASEVECIPYVWTPECQESFDKIKYILTHAPASNMADPTKPFSLVCDALRVGLGFILCQEGDDGLLHPVHYSGKSLKGVQSRYSVIELDILSIVEGIRFFHSYLAADHFTVYTDHISATFIDHLKLASQSRLVRWCIFLQQYSCSVRYKAGRHIGAADFLSRLWPAAPPMSIDKDGLIDDQLEDSPGPITLHLSAASVSARSNSYTLRTFDQPSPNAPIAAVNATTPPSLADFRSALSECPDFRDIFTYLSSRKLPRNSTTARRILMDTQNYELENGLLYCRTRRGKNSALFHTCQSQTSSC
jgi:RNase H-like domain found in reverse transcriptase